MPIAKLDQSAHGVHTTSTASDTVVTGLSRVTGCQATLQSDVAAGAAFVSVALSATPGSIVIKTWQTTGAAANAFSKAVSWTATGDA
jgi:hypothetical protein